MGNLSFLSKIQIIFFITRSAHFLQVDWSLSVRIFQHHTTHFAAGTVGVAGQFEKIRTICVRYDPRCTMHEERCWYKISEVHRPKCQRIADLITEAARALRLTEGLVGSGYNNGGDSPVLLVFCSVHQRTRS